MAARQPHDRRIPRTTANIDHIVIAPSGIWIVDAKRYRGAIKRIDKGGWFRTDLRLTVGGRDRTKLIDGLHKQHGHVVDALSKSDSELPQIHGVLCFVEGEFSLFSRPFTMSDVLITWPKALYKQLLAAGPITVEEREILQRVLAERLPPAA